MAMVEVAFTPLPAHVRTARLVAVAVARRSGVAESLLDEVRLAVGEACSRAVEAHRQYCPAEPVRIALNDTEGRFEVVVTDAGHGTAADDESAARGGSAALVAAGAVRSTGLPGDQSSPPAGDQTGGPDGDDAAEPRNGVPAPLGNGSGGLQDGFGLAVIAELADDVKIARTPAGISVSMSWPSSANGH